MIDRVRIPVQVLVERQRYLLTARVLIHGDEAPDARIVVPGSEVVQPAVLVEVLARVAVVDRGGR